MPCSGAISPPSGACPVQAAAGCFPMRGRCCLSCSADCRSPSQCLAAGLEPGQDTPLAEKYFLPKSEPAASNSPALVLLLTSTWCPSSSEGEHCQSIPPSLHLPSTHLLPAPIPPPPCSSLNNSSSAWRCADCSPVLPLVIAQPSKTDIVLCGSSRISHSSPQIIFLLGHGILHAEREVPPPFITPILAARASGPTPGG